MTTEQLLQPRVMVKLNYPNSPFKVGDILTRYEYGKVKYYSKHSHYKGNDELIDAADIDTYPEIFKPLNWYEYRSIEDMPEYVKNIFFAIVVGVNCNNKHHGSISKVTNHFESEFGFGDGCAIIDTEGDDCFMPYTHCEPATEQDYITFKQSK